MREILFIIGIIAVLFVSVQYVQAQEEEVHTFYGLDDIFKDPDTVVKLYKSGGFSLKNYEMGMAIFAHPISQTEMFKVTVLYDGKVSRFLMESEALTESEPQIEIVTESGAIIIESEITERIEPKSSLGADITKYDIPTQGRNDGLNPRITVSFLDPNSIFINDEYTPAITIKNEYGKAVTADMEMIITRNSKIIHETSEEAVNGYWSPVVDILYPEFIPGFCYEIEITAVSGNLTSSQTEDFLATTTAKYWQNAGENVIENTNPTQADKNCNE